MAQAPGPKVPPPSIGRAYGKITDSTGLPVGQATALVMKSNYDTATKKKKPVLLKGIDTKANGEFNFEDLPVGRPARAESIGNRIQEPGYSI